MTPECVSLNDVYAVTTAQEQTAVAVLAELCNCDPESEHFVECKKNVKNIAPAICDLHRKAEILKAVSDGLKKQIEYAANLVEMPNEFKWQKPRKSTTCTNMNMLFELAKTEGVTSEYFLSKCKPITSKDAADILGLSEQAMLERMGDIFETKESKPVLKRLY